MMWKIRQKNVIVFVVLLMSLALLAGCVTKMSSAGNPVVEAAETQQPNENPEKKITYMTSGMIKGDTVIAIRFSDDQVPESELHKPLRNLEVFTFEPVIEGKYYWDDRQTIVFKPDQPLLKANRYTGILHLDVLFPEIDGVTPKIQAFEFETLGQGVVSYEGDLELINPDDPSQLIFKGQLVLAEKCELAQLKKAVEFLEDGKKRKLEIAQENEQTYKFQSEMIPRTDADKYYTFRINKDILGMEVDLEKQYLLSSINTLQVVRVEEIYEDGASQIRVVFSDELAPHRNYTGYVNLRPALDIRVEAEDNALLIKGDFESGQMYKLNLLSGISSRLGKELKTTEDIDLEIQISDNKPKLEFANSGVFLTTAKDKRIAFRTMNIERVQIKVKKVEEENLIRFFENHSFNVHDGSYRDYDMYSFRRVGELIDSKVVYIGSEKNKWIQSEIDLSKVIVDGESNLYIVQLEYEVDDALFFPGYWNNWDIRDYVWENGQQTKHLILSDLGITAKRDLDQTHVFVTDILQATPIEGATVLLKDKENQVIQQATTDVQGMCTFTKTGDYIEVKKRDQYSILPFRNTGLNTSLFDVHGIDTSSGMKAFIYTDRGVYRPGDEIHLSVIARNDANTFPENHPITLKVYNPKGKLVIDQTERQAKDGFYTFTFATKDTALTGDWRAELHVGSTKFKQIIKIEEIVPYRIKVEVKPKLKELMRDDSRIDYTIASKYLFGTPANGLEYRSQVTIEPYPVGFERFRDFTFSNESMDFDGLESYEYEGQLDEEGQVEISWNLPGIYDVPSGVRAKIEARVLEKGGRPVPTTNYIPINVYERYVGIQKLENSRLEMGDKVQFTVVLVDQDGEWVAGKDLRYRIYRLRRYWWWEYSSRDSFKRHYKTDSDTELVKEGLLTSKDGVVKLDYHLDDYGEMFIEVEDPDSGHSAGYFFRSYWWGSEASSKSADIVNIKTDQEKYNPGDIASIILKTPEKGRALVTVEKAGKIVYKQWEEIISTNTEIQIPVREEYVPNAYVSVAIFQPYQETINDMPIRMYGIIPLKVEKEDTHLNFTVDTPESIEPGAEFEIAIHSEKQAQFTVAVVDEGLLALTQFRTPRPWNHFFQKERLLTTTYDTFSDVIGLNWGYMYNVFSVGGDVFREAYEEKQQQNVKAKRFKPVVMFAGPIGTDASGEAKVSFKMPEYIGQVRVMVIGATGGSYGSEEKRITVKSPLMVMPTLPRVLGPEDQIEVPVTVFGMEEGIGDVKVQLEVEGPLKVVGETEKTLVFAKPANKDLAFNIEVNPAIGEAKVKVIATSATYQAEKTIDIAVRAYSPYMYLSTEKVIKSGESVTFIVPEEGIENSTSAKVTLATRKGLNLNHRLKYLIRYPYGCIEQTTSSVFPQLFMKDIFVLTEEKIAEIDENVNAGIERLRKFQLSNGGFSYWPNGDYPSHWGTNYAGHFMLEAKKRGYYVPQDLFDNWLKYQTDVARDNSHDTLIRTYRLYLLALADQPVLNAMNYLRESKMDQMSNTAKYYLAAAYKVAGYDKTAKEMMKNLEPQVDEDMDYTYSYGSRLRNKAIILEIMTLFKEYDDGLALYNELAERLSSDDWYSTQTTAYSLQALSKYLGAMGSKGTQMKGTVTLSDKNEMEFSTTQAITSVALENSFGQEITVTNRSKKPLFANLEWEGIPLQGEVGETNKNLTLTVEWLDENGNYIDPTELPQGTTFWGHFRVEKEARRSLTELALVQILPSGWEIENLRLLGGDLPRWTENNFYLNQEEYLDIRDDRIMWFFDMGSYDRSYDFLVKLNTVTVGEFYLPPTLVEAMYDNNYKATKAGKRVKVIKP